MFSMSAGLNAIVSSALLLSPKMRACPANTRNAAQRRTSAFSEMPDGVLSQCGLWGHTSPHRNAAILQVLQIEFAELAQPAVLKKDIVDHRRIGNEQADRFPPFCVRSRIDTRPGIFVRS